MSFVVSLLLWGRIIPEIAVLSILLLSRGAIPESHGKRIACATRQHCSPREPTGRVNARPIINSATRGTIPGYRFRLRPLSYGGQVAHPGYAYATFFTACRIDPAPWPRAIGHGRGHRCGWSARGRGSPADADTSDAWRCAPRARP